MTRSQLMTLVLAYGQACRDEEVAYASDRPKKEKAAVAEQQRLLRLIKEKTP